MDRKALLYETLQRLARRSGALQGDQPDEELVAAQAHDLQAAFDRAAVFREELTRIVERDPLAAIRAFALQALTTLEAKETGALCLTVLESRAETTGPEAAIAMDYLRRHPPTERRDRTRVIDAVVPLADDGRMPFPWSEILALDVDRGLGMMAVRDVDEDTCIETLTACPTDEADPESLIGLALKSWPSDDTRAELDALGASRFRTLVFSRLTDEAVPLLLLKGTQAPAPVRFDLGCLVIAGRTEAAALLAGAAVEDARFVAHSHAVLRRTPRYPRSTPDVPAAWFTLLSRTRDPKSTWSELLVWLKTASLDEHARFALLFCALSRVELRPMVVDYIRKNPDPGGVWALLHRGLLDPAIEGLEPAIDALKDAHVQRALDRFGARAPAALTKAISSRLRASSRGRPPSRSA